MFHVRFSPRAVADLEEIKRYLSDDLCNPQTAADLVALVFEKVRALVAMPQTGARLRTGIPVLKGYRFIPCKNDLVCYRIEGTRVSVIRVLYTRRDYRALLDPDKTGDADG